jgi:DNA modification methylase
MNQFSIIQQTPAVVPIESIVPHERNVNEGDIGAIHESIGANGFYGRVLVQESTRKILAGKHRWLAARQQGATEIPVELLDVDDATAIRVMLADNRTARLGHDDEDALAALLQEISDDQGDLAGTGYDGDFLDELLSELETLRAGACEAASAEQVAAARQTLAERFGVPPFSVLDARQGYWQERKRAWLALGIQSEVGRDEELTFARSAQNPAIYELRNQMREAAGGVDPSWPEIIAEAQKRGLHLNGGTSIFDPVLCELAYRWFCPEGGRVLDPFAGGSVRGLVAAKLGREYRGIDLSERQVEANRANWQEFKAHCPTAPEPSWEHGDSAQSASYVLPCPVDFVFSCPPYADLEKYSDDPRDLSNMEYDEFLTAYFEIIAQACARLKENRFACFVVGDVRDKRGFYRNFVSDTIRAFERAGMRLYNEAILVTQVGSLAIRVNAQFGNYRKLGKSHQNVLVFYKGDPKKIPDILGETEFGDLSVEAGVGGEELNE